jgi:glutamyl-tRNA synthetase
VRPGRLRGKLAPETPSLWHLSRMTVRGRYAPSPTGTIHLGNASTALIAWLSARARGGAYVMRLEDLDAPRVVEGAAERILGDLAWLGLDWDEGPDVGGACAPYTQSERLRFYDEAFDRLRQAGFVYPCFCSRRDIQAAASAPQTPGDEVLYPGTCRALGEDEVARRIAAGRAHAWRFRVEEGCAAGFDDLVRGRFDLEPGAIGDFVVRRADGVPAYQLAVVVDDVAMGITEVVRGGDLLASTVRQILLYRALAAEPPAFAHVPLVLGNDGVRLSKRHQGVTLAEFRDDGVDPEAIVGRLARLLGLRRSAARTRARDLIEGFDLETLRGVADIRLPPTD